MFFHLEVPTRASSEGAFGQVAEFNDSCLHDIVLYGKESPGGYLETNSRKDNIEE